MRIIIAGGRDFNDYKLLKKSCHRILHQLSDEKLCSPYIHIENKLSEIVCGKAKGADTLGKQFGKEYGFKIKYFPANWDLYGKSAGYRRNDEMAIYAKEDNGILIAFWDGKSKGTKHMIDLANKHGLRVFIINY